MIRISDYLDVNLVMLSDLDSRNDVMNAMINLLDSAGKLKDRKSFQRAIYERENLMSTGIGMGVAIPHAKLPGYEDFFIAVAVLQNGVDWKALDGALVRLVFMIGGPDNKQMEYLHILSNLTKVIKDEKTRKKVLTSNSKEAIIQPFM